MSCKPRYTIINTLSSFTLAIMVTLGLYALNPFINQIHAQSTKTIQPKAGPYKPGSNADDPAIWIHPTDRTRSLMFLSDKDTGIYVYNFSGTQIQHVDFGTSLNNIDVRKGFNYGGRTIDILAGNLRDTGKLAVLEIKPDWTQGNAVTMLSGPSSTGNTISSDSYGFTLYRRPSDGKMYAFDKSKNSNPIIQWEVNGTNGTITTTNVRQIAGIGVAEGFVADDKLGFVYFSEEGGSIHKYNADPSAGNQKISAFGTDVSTADREGLALYECNDGTGYIVLSSQGSSTFPVFTREGNNTHVLTFTAQGASGTDGLDVISWAAPNFPNGVLIIHNDPDMDYYLYNWSDLGLKTCIDGGAGGATITPPTTTPPITTITTSPTVCVNKSKGDADCIPDGVGKQTTIVDFQIWRGEFFAGCSSTNSTGTACQVDDDKDGILMDANFDYPGSGYTTTDSVVTIADFEIWRKGYFGGITLTPTVTPVVTVTTIPPTATPTSIPGVTTTPGPAGAGIWISKSEIMARPTSGAAWSSLLATANSASPTGGDIANQDSNHDVQTLAAALVCVRLNDPNMCTKARSAVVSAINTEEGGRWLAVGRNLGSYIIAADLLGLYADSNANSEGSRVYAWLNKFYTRTLQSNVNAGIQHQWRESAWASGSNASAQEGFAYASLAVYLKKQEGITWAWDGFRRYAGDRTSPVKISANDASWQFKPDDNVGIQDAGATKGGCRMDGAIANDMSRGGSYSCSPGYTSYPWVGLEGAVPAAVVLDRAGYPAFTVANNAILRTHEYLWEIRQRTGNVDWFDGTRADEVVYLVNKKYGKSFIINGATGIGRTVGFTDWTH